MDEEIKVGDAVHAVGENIAMTVEEILEDGTAICANAKRRDRYEIRDLRKGRYPPLNIAYGKE